MSEYANNIPTNDKVFTPMEPSEIPSIIADIEEESPYGEDDPARAVDDLIKSMMPQRAYLMEILKAAREPISMDDIKGLYNEMWEYRPTVFSAYDLCVLLEEAGGIERVDGQGNPYDMDAADPILVTDDIGATYYLANEPADMYWSILPAGQTILDDDDPISRAKVFFDNDEDLQPLFKRLLTLCAEDGGKTWQELDDAISFDSLVMEPRVYASFFIDRMEKADAIEWSGSWVTTAVGHDALDLLAEVEDNYSPEEQAALKATYLETWEDLEPVEDIEFTGTLKDEAAIKAASTLATDVEDVSHEMKLRTE